jgi:hypothetical protein
MKRTQKPKDYPTLAEHYKKKYPSHIAVLESSPLQKARAHGITEYDVVGLGRQLDQFRSMVKMYEANSSMAQLDQLPKIGLDVISANFGISPLPLIAGVQPIPDEIGIVWFEDFQAQNNRGNVTAGQNLITSLSAPDVYPQNYSSDTLLTSNFLTTAGGGNHATYAGVSLGGTQDLIAPVDPQRITIYGTATFNAGADVATFGTMIVDPASGQASNSVVVNGTLYTVYCVVDFDAGTVNVTFNATPSGAVSLYSDFAVLEEAADDIVSAILVMQSKPVKARFFAMKSTFGLFQQFVAQKRWGLNIQDEMTKKLVQAVNNEVMNIALAKILSLVPSNATKTWVREPGSGIDYLSHKLSLPDALTDTSKLITINAGRGHANVWIAGVNAAAVLEALPGFTKTFDDMTFGPHVFGTYRGATIVRVPSPAQMNPDLMVGIYKGETPFEAPVVWAPFMPLTVTDVLIAGVNPLQYQKAAAMSGAIDTMIPNFLCSLTIDQTNFDYASL